MMWGKFRDRNILGDYATWAGDEVGVAIAAESEQIAEQALKLVDVQWQELPYVMDPISRDETGRSKKFIRRLLKIMCCPLIQ